MTSEIKTSSISAQTQQWTGQTNGVQLQILTRTFRSSHLKFCFKNEIKIKFLKTNCKAEDYRPATTLKMKSTAAFFKDLNTKFGTINYSTDICIIAIKQNSFYWFWSCKNLHSRNSTTRKSTFGSSSQRCSGKRYSQHLSKTHKKCLRRSPLFCKAACLSLQLCWKWTVTVTLQGFCQDHE